MTAANKLNNHSKPNTPNLPVQTGQKYLGDKGLLALVGFLGAFIPLSTDLYLPALPFMADSFQVSPSLINLTLTLFFVFYAAGTLFWGPLSDKYGRKPILLTGLIFYMAAGILCAFSANIYQLIVFRVLQAVVGGAVTSVASAVIKDVYQGRKREAALALVFSVGMFAPIVAPILGAFVLKLTSWRGIFWVLAAAGLLGFAGAAALEETIQQRNTGSVLHSLSRLGVVLKNSGFTFLLVTFSLRTIPLMAFISASSFIYVDQFGLSAEMFSYFFAGNAVFLVLGPMLYMRLSRRFERRAIINVCFGIMGLCGVLVFGFGTLSPWLFALSLLPGTLSISLINTPGASLLLGQHKEDTGSVSALMNCSVFVFGGVGMIIASFNWTNRIYVLGALNLIVGFLSLLLWQVVSRRPDVARELAKKS